MVAPLATWGDTSPCEVAWEVQQKSGHRLTEAAGKLGSYGRYSWDPEAGQFCNRQTVNRLTCPATVVLVNCFMVQIAFTYFIVWCGFKNFEHFWQQ